MSYLERGGVIMLNPEKNMIMMMFATSLILLLSIVLLLSGLTPSCGPEKRTIVEVEQPPQKDPDVIIKEPVEKFCDGLPVSTIRDKKCPDEGIGKIVEVCRPDGQWYEASRDCRQGCEQDVVTWENFVKDVMIESCVNCHGTYREYEIVRNLANSGLGGAGGVSKLVYYITLPESNDASMPKNLPNLDNETIQKIKSWVEGGQPRESSCEIKEASNSVDLFYIDEAINRFGNRIPSAEDRRNYRFFTFAHDYNLGKDLSHSYKALNRAINSLSFENDIQLCQPIDPKGVVCAMDIEALGLTRDDFRVVTYGTDVVFQSNTTLGLVNQDLFDTREVFFHYDNFIDGVYSNTNIYNFIMGFEDRNQIFSIFGIDIEQDILDNDYKLIGTNESTISAAFNTRLIGIFEGEINGFDTQIHISFDNSVNQNDNAQADLFQNPFLGNSDKIFSFEASESIAGLPNGLFAFFLNEDDNQLADFAPTNIVNCNDKDLCLDAQIDAPVDCFACHQPGLLPKLDVIGDHIRGSRQFNADDVKLAKQVYLDQNVNAATFNKHNKRYLKALGQIGIQAGERNHFIQAYKEFNLAYSLEKLAAFLFVSPDYLRGCINSSANLAELVGGLLAGSKITADTFFQAAPIILEECEINIDPTIPVSGG